MKTNLRHLLRRLRTGRIDSGTQIKGDRTMDKHLAVVALIYKLRGKSVQRENIAELLETCWELALEDGLHISDITDIYGDWVLKISAQHLEKNDNAEFVGHSLKGLALLAEKKGEELP